MGNPAKVDLDDFIECFVPILGNFVILEPVTDALGHAGVSRLRHVHADEVVAGGSGTLFGGGPALELLRLNEQLYSHVIFSFNFCVSVDSPRPQPSMRM